MPREKSAIRPLAKSGQAVTEGASAKIEDFRIEDNFLLGLQIARGLGKLSFKKGAITKNKFGINVQSSPGFQPEKVFFNVMNKGNAAMDFTTDEVYVPKALDLGPSDLK